MRNWLCLLGIFLILSIWGCSSSVYTPPIIPTETPVMSMTSLTPLLRCGSYNLRKAIESKGSFLTTPERKERLKRFLVIINPSDFIDGTIRPNNNSEGKLFDVGHLQLKAIFTRWFPREVVLITVDEIPFLRSFGLFGSAVSDAGGLPKERYDYLKKIYKVDHIYHLTGAFYKLDGEIPLRDSRLCNNC